MRITDQIRAALSECKTLEAKVELLNEIREVLMECSPFSNEPVDKVLWVKSEDVKANEYNPNKVASPEMKLLYESIRVDGYTQPIVVYRLEDGTFEIVDGFHRNRVGKEYTYIRERVKGYLPVVVIDKPVDERMGSTIRHNRARGTHQIGSMSELVIKLVKMGWPDDRICKQLGMEKEEVLRLKQISGLQEAFLGHQFSKSWSEFERVNFPDEVGIVGKTICKKPTRRNRSS